MRSSASYIYPVLATFLLTTVVAQDPDDNYGPGFNAPPLENANLAFYTILLLVTLIQVIGAISYLFRSRSPHLLPGISAVVAFSFLSISYALGIAITVTAWTFNQDSEQIVHGQAYLNIDIPASLFFEWVDPAMFTVVALVLRDRYYAYSKHASPSSAGNHPLPLLLFTCCTWALIAILFLVSSASTGIFAATYTASYNNAISSDQFDADIRLSNRFDRSFVAFSVITTIVLSLFAIVVNRHAKTDKIASVTLFYIIPVLCARALARIIFEIVNVLLPLSSSWTDSDPFALDFATTVVYGVLFFIVASILLYFFLNPRLWNDPDQLSPYGHFHQHLAYPLGGISPRDQFPEQWGHSQNRLVPSDTNEGVHGKPPYPSLAGADYAKPQPSLQTVSANGDQVL